MLQFFSLKKTKDSTHALPILISKEYRKSIEFRISPLGNSPLGANLVIRYECKANYAVLKLAS